MIVRRYSSSTFLTSVACNSYGALSHKQECMCRKCIFDKLFGDRLNTCKDLNKQNTSKNLLVAEIK